MVEYWTPHGDYEKPNDVFEYKSSTNLFDFKKAKSVPTSLTISPTSTQFATFSLPDRQIRVFDFASAKLLRTYDESIETLTTMQQAGTAVQKLEDVDFGKRLAVEREIEGPASKNKINVIPRSGKTATEGGLENWKDIAIVVDGSRMNKIIKIDQYNMQATVQAGVKLQTLEDELRKIGYTTGHSPQSKPVAQFGGLLATRSIGQFSTLYGAIEDMVVYW